jgi:hypothetical protein
MDRLDHVMIAFSLLLMLWVLASLRRAHIRVEYSVSWLAAALVLLAAFEWPSGQRWLAQALGVEDAHLAVLMTAGAVFLAVLYRLSLILSRLKDLNIAVTQRVAILEFRLQALEKTRSGQ